MEANYLLKMFQLYGYPRNFRRKTIDGMNKATNERAKSNKIAFLYTENVPEMTVSLLEPQNIEVAHIPNKMM